jgi:hypothetical protein
VRACWQLSKAAGRPRYALQLAVHVRLDETFGLWSMRFGSACVPGVGTRCALRILGWSWRPVG